MIKKNTKIVIEANGSKETEELEGGIPLSKGETVMIRKDGTAAEYEVSEKKTEIFYENDDRIVSISYHLRKKYEWAGREILNIFLSEAFIRTLDLPISASVEVDRGFVGQLLLA